MQSKGTKPGRCCGVHGRDIFVRPGFITGISGVLYAKLIGGEKGGRAGCLSVLDVASRVL